MTWRLLLSLTMVLSLSGCFNEEKETETGTGDDHDHSTHLQAQAKGSIEGEVIDVNSTGLALLTDNGTQISVVFNANTLADDDTPTNLTDVQVGDRLEVSGDYDELNQSINAVKIEIANDVDADELNDDNGAVLVVGAGIVDAPSVYVESVDADDSDSHIEIEGTVASIVGNVVVVNILETEHSTLDLGTQISVTLSNEFLQMGSLSQIAVGTNIELKGTFDVNNMFTVRLLKVRSESSINVDNDDQALLSDDSSDTDNGIDDIANDDNAFINDDAGILSDDTENDSEDSIEAIGTVVSLNNGVMSVVITNGMQTNLAINTMVTIDTTSVAVDSNAMPIAVGASVELEGRLDIAGNFIIVEVSMSTDSSTDDSVSPNSFMTSTGGMTSRF